MPTTGRAAWKPLPLEMRVAQQSTYRRGSWLGSFLRWAWLLLALEKFGEVLEFQKPFFRAPRDAIPPETLVHRASVLGWPQQHQAVLVPELHPRALSLPKP